MTESLGEDFRSMVTTNREKSKEKEVIPVIIQGKQKCIYKTTYAEREFYINKMRFSFNF